MNKTAPNILFLTKFIQVTEEIIQKTALNGPFITAGFSACLSLGLIMFQYFKHFIINSMNFTEPLLLLK